MGKNPYFGKISHVKKVITLLKMISEDEINYFKNGLCLQHYYYNLIKKEIQQVTNCQKLPSHRSHYRQMKFNINRME